MTAPPTEEQVMAVVVALLRDFNGREFADVITPQTKFIEDLGLASIDAVVLGEMLEKHYGRKIPFHRFLATKAQENALDLEVGELVRYLYEQLRQPPDKSNP